MKLDLKIKVLAPVVSLKEFRIPISAKLNYKIGIRVEGFCECFVKDSVADFFLDLELRPNNALIPNALFTLAKGFVEQTVLEKIIYPLKTSEKLLEYSFKIDGKDISL
jgi:hypothetical protein